MEGLQLLLLLALTIAVFVAISIWVPRSKVVKKDEPPIKRHLDSLLLSFKKAAPPIRAGTLELLYVLGRAVQDAAPYFIEANPNPRSPRARIRDRRRA